MTERFLQLKKQFRIGNSNFSLQACRWKAVNFKQKNLFDDSCKKQISFVIPNIRINQTSVVLSNHIYMFGGVPKNMEKQTFCAINLKNNRWHRIDAKQNPQGRDSYGLTLLQQAIYLFGGSNQNKYFNDLYTFNTFTNVWTKIQNSYKTPQPRDPMVFIGIKNQLLLLIGGINLQQKKYFQDVYIWKKNVWTHLMTQNYPKNLIGFKACECNDRIFLFGGINRKTGEYNNKIYEVQIDEQNLVNFKEIILNINIFPEGRIHHQMITVNNQYFIVIGGQIIGKKIFKDIWLFDVYLFRWTRIQPKNGPLRGIHSFSAIFQDNIIYLIGGFLENRQQISDQVLMVQFANEEIFKSTICQKCTNVIQKKQQQNKKYPKDLNISVGFFYNLALQIKFPFHAVSMIYEASKYFNPTYFKLKIEKTLSNFDFIRIQFDGCSFGYKEFEQFITHRNLNSHIKMFTEKLKLGAFRLGKTFLFISSDKKYRYVYLLSAQSRITPHFDQIYIYYAYVENIQLQRIETEQGIKQRSFIVNILKSYILKPEILLNTPQRNLLLIFENKIVMSAQKNYLSEFNSSENDITIWKNQKKIQFLQQRGYELRDQIQISLQTYMKFYHLNPNKEQPQFYLNNSNKPINFIKYKAILDTMLNRKMIEKVQIPKIQGLQITGQIYVTQLTNLISSNYGLLIYSNGKLFNRYGIQFGKLFPQCFYKTKYKKAKTIFYELGYINLIGLEQNMFKNGFIKNQVYCILLEQIQRICNKQKQNSNIDLEEEQYKSSKRVKN